MPIAPEPKRRILGLETRVAVGEGEGMDMLTWCIFLFLVGLDFLL